MTAACWKVGSCRDQYQNPLSPSVEQSLYILKLGVLQTRSSVFESAKHEMIDSRDSRSITSDWKSQVKIFLGGCDIDDFYSQLPSLRNFRKHNMCPRIRWNEWTTVLQAQRSLNWQSDTSRVTQQFLESSTLRVAQQFLEQGMQGQGHLFGVWMEFLQGEVPHLYVEGASCYCQGETSCWYPDRASYQ